MSTTRKRRQRQQRQYDEFRDLVLRYFKGETLTHKEELRVLTSTVRPGRKTLDEWRRELLGTDAMGRGL